MKKFGRSSLAKLSTCHTDIQKVFLELIKVTKVDISVVYGLRTVKEQQALYAKGRTTQGNKVTNCDGVDKKSKHQEQKKGEGASAIDICIYTAEPKYRSKVRYDQAHLAYIAGLVDVIVDNLLAKGEITHRLRWGGNWDGDGVIMFDQKLQDLCHWELSNA